MRTPSQVQASRSNGAKSKGPTSAAGKRNSSRNSTRHGILAETIVLETENSPRFIELSQELFEEHDPQTPTEVMLVQTLVAARWRMGRTWGLQKIAFDADTAAGDPDLFSPAALVKTLRTSPDSVRVHELFLRYEVALDRQISRTLLRLQQLQEKRLARGTAATPSAPAKRTRQPIENTVELSTAASKRTPVPSTAKAYPPLVPVPEPRTGRIQPDSAQSASKIRPALVL